MNETLSYVIDKFYSEACQDAKEMWHFTHTNQTQAVVVANANSARNKVITPAKFRKKPVVIEAYQTDVPLEIQTLEGRMTAPAGWWVIKGVAGEYYACAPDVFAQTYDPVEE